MNQNCDRQLVSVYQSYFDELRLLREKYFWSQYAQDVLNLD